MRVRITVENEEVLAPTLRRESLLPVPEDGHLHIALPVAHTRLLHKLMSVVDDLVEAYACQQDIRDHMLRLDSIIEQCKKEA
jgi:hypothetical protein